MRVPVRTAPDLAAYFSRNSVNTLRDAFIVQPVTLEGATGSVVAQIIRFLVAGPVGCRLKVMNSLMNAMPVVATEMQRMNANMSVITANMGVMTHNMDSTMGRMGRAMPWMPW